MSYGAQRQPPTCPMPPTCSVLAPFEPLACHMAPSDNHRHALCLPSALPSLCLSRFLACRMAPSDNHRHALCLPSAVLFFRLSRFLACRMAPRLAATTDMPNASHLQCPRSISDAFSRVIWRPATTTDMPYTPICSSLPSLRLSCFSRVIQRLATTTDMFYASHLNYPPAALAPSQQLSRVSYGA